MGFKMKPKFRVSYWSNSPVAEYIRKIFNAPAKPKYATTGEWNQWENTQKHNHKIAYWITEIGLRKLQNFLYYPYDVYYSINYYLTYRFLKKSHYLPTRLEAGEYHSVSERVLHGLFEALVDYVEIDLAKREYYFNNIKYNFYNKYKTAWWSSVKRSSDLGLNYLIDNVSKVENGKLTKHAQESHDIFYLYNWWKRRPYRIDPWKASGLKEFNKKFITGDTLFIDYDSLSDLDSKKKEKCFSKMQEIEEMYAEEDQKEMIKLIKIIDTLN